MIVNPRKQKKKITKAKYSQYKQYLNSHQWKEKRQSAFDFYGKECCLCGNRHNLQVHHRSYKNLYKETMADLMILCETCHYRHHKNDRERKHNKPAKLMRHEGYDVTPVTFYPDRVKK